MLTSDSHRPLEFSRDQTIELKSTFDLLDDPEPRRAKTRLDAARSLAGIAVLDRPFNLIVWLLPRKREI